MRVCVRVRCLLFPAVCVRACEVLCVRACEVLCVRACEVLCVRACEVLCVRACEVLCVRACEVLCVRASSSCFSISWRRSRRRAPPRGNSSPSADRK